MQKKIFKLTTNASVSTTRKTKLTETDGDYTLQGEYQLGDKEPKSGTLEIKATGIVYVENVDFVEEN